LLNVPGENQTGVIGGLLILSVLVPNIGKAIREVLDRRSRSLQDKVEKKRKEVNL